jgi:hypothetical protein
MKRPTPVELPTGDEEQAEWQPVRIAPESYTDQFHTIRAPFHTKCQMVLVRARPAIPSIVLLSTKAMYRNAGCPSIRFYEVHKEDARKLGFWTDEQVDTYFPLVLCEHQILAD